MRLHRLRVTVEPWWHSPSKLELRVQVIADNEEFNVLWPIEPNDFEPLFDVIMDRIKDEIKEHIKRREIEDVLS